MLPAGPELSPAIGGLAAGYSGSSSSCSLIDAIKWNHRRTTIMITAHQMIQVLSARKAFIRISLN